MPRAIAVLVIATLSSTPAWSEIFVGVDLGAGRLDIDNISVAPDFELTSVSDSAAAYHVTAGYEFDNGFQVLGAYEQVDSIEFLGIGESVDLTALKLGIGYRGHVSERFLAGATIGLAAWDLEARESILFNPGPEATGGLDDTDVYAELSIEWAISESFRMPLTFNYNNYDFGNSTVWRVGVRVHF